MQISDAHLPGHAAAPRHLRQRAIERMEVQINERLEMSRDVSRLHDTLLQGIQRFVLLFHALAGELPGNSHLRIKMTKVLDSADQVIAEGQERIKSLRRDAHSRHGLKEEDAQRLPTDFCKDLEYFYLP